MEGFEIICKYNERCMQWRAECATLLAKWANAGDDKDYAFSKEANTVAGFLCAKGNGVQSLLAGVYSANIDHVVLALRYLRNKQQKPSCEFCTRFAEKGEHVQGCIGDSPMERCPFVLQLATEQAPVQCRRPLMHIGSCEFIASVSTRSAAH